MINKIIVLFLVGFVWGYICRILDLPTWFVVFIGFVVGWYWNKIWTFFGGN